jgi:hypothetical protein
MKLTLPKAFEIIEKQPVPTVASPEIQKQILSRIGSYPQKAFEESHHYSRIIVPLPLAYVLQKKPELIAHAVTTFYYREPIAFRVLTIQQDNHLHKIKQNQNKNKKNTNTNKNKNKNKTKKKYMIKHNCSYISFRGSLIYFVFCSQVCHKMEKFNPKTNPNVLIRVRFTRCLFAQLIKQHFQPPRVYSDLVPSPSDPNHKPFELGMKVVRCQSQFVLLCFVLFVCLFGLFVCVCVCLFVFLFFLFLFCFVLLCLFVCVFDWLMDRTFLSIYKFIKVRCIKM